MPRGSSVRYRDPKTGRWTKSGGKKKVLLEGYVGTKRVFKDDTPQRYAAPKAEPKIDKRSISFEKMTEFEIKGLSLDQALGKNKVLHRIGRGKREFVRLTLTATNAQGEQVKIKRTIKLAMEDSLDPKTGRKVKRSVENRRKIVRELIENVALKGLRLSPKKFRTGAMKRTPTAKNVRIQIDAA